MASRRNTRSANKTVKSVAGDIPHMLIVVQYINTRFSFRVDIGENLGIVLNRVKTVFDSTTAAFPDKRYYSSFSLMKRDGAELTGDLLSDSESLVSGALYNIVFSQKKLKGLETGEDDSKVFFKECKFSLTQRFLRSLKRAKRSKSPFLPLRRVSSEVERNWESENAYERNRACKDILTFRKIEDHSSAASVGKGSSPKGTSTRIG